MRMIFVFGSNTAGRHGKGAALEARLKWGARYGQGVGLQGNSYAIPTKDERMRTLPLERIRQYVNSFLKFAGSPVGRDYTFQVTRIGCGLAGYQDWEIAPLFEGFPHNVMLPNGWPTIIRMGGLPTEKLKEIHSLIVDGSGDLTRSAESVFMDRMLAQAVEYQLKERGICLP